ELAGLGSDLAFDAGEEADETIKIVLRPAVERMVMTLRALNAHTGECLRHVEGYRFGIELALRNHRIKIDRRVFQIAAGRSNLRTHELIERRVLAHLVENPFVVGKRGLAVCAEGAVSAANDLQGLSPFGSPQIGELAALEQRVDQLGALVTI